MNPHPKTLGAMRPVHKIIMMPRHKMMGQTLQGTRRVYFSEASGEIVEEILGETSGGIPLRVSSTAPINRNDAQEYLDQLGAAMRAQDCAAHGFRG